MGEAKRRRDARAAYLAQPLHLQQPPLPVLLCECLRPGWDGAETLDHVYCCVPYWLGPDGQDRMRAGWMR